MHDSKPADPFLLSVRSCAKKCSRNRDEALHNHNDANADQYMIALLYSIKVIPEHNHGCGMEFHMITSIEDNIHFIEGVFI